MVKKILENEVQQTEPVEEGFQRQNVMLPYYNAKCAQNRADRAAALRALDALIGRPAPSIH